MSLIIRLPPYHFLYNKRYFPGPRDLTPGEAQTLNDQLELRTKIWAERWWPRTQELSLQSIESFDGKLSDWVRDFVFSPRIASKAAQAQGLEKRLADQIAAIQGATGKSWAEARIEAIWNLGHQELTAQRAMAGISRQAGLPPTDDRL